MQQAAAPGAMLAFTGTVGFLGPDGTFCHDAAELAFPQASFVPFLPIEQVIEAVSTGEVEKALVPCLNALIQRETDNIQRVYRKLLSSRVYVELISRLRIEMALLGCKGGSIEQVSKVHSAAAAFGQCKAWLAAHSAVEQVVEESTAAAAELAANDPTHAIIGSPQIATRKNLVVLESPLQDAAVDHTWFYTVVAGLPPARGDDLTLLAIRAKRADASGDFNAIDKALAGSVRITEKWQIADSDIGIWHFLELRGHRSEESVVEAIDTLGKNGMDVRTLGCYPEWERP